MATFSRKIAMVGMWGVGKTSLVQRFVHSIYDETYHSTIGVKVDKKVVERGGDSMTLMLWDIAGAEDERGIPMHYLSGAAAYLLVMDGTRSESVDVGLELANDIEQTLGALPFVAVVNKSDLEWEVDLENVSAKFDTLTTGVLSSSAKTGENVERAFMQLAELL